MARTTPKKRAEDKAKRAARAAALLANYKRMQADPTSALFDDPIWNPLHRLYPRVSQLIEKERMIGGAAEDRARMEETFDIISEGLGDGSLPPK